jgi:flagellar biogenesis protein FliO
MTFPPSDPVMLASLAIALGGVLCVVLGWRRTRQPAGNRERISLVTSRYLGGKRMLTLVEVDGERLLLGLSGNTVRLVARLTPRGPRRRDVDGATEAPRHPVAPAGADLR